MSSDSWIPAEIPLDKPNAARMYDYMLGGYHNLEVDRALSDKMIAVYPDVTLAARANRAFLRRAVSFVCDQGIDQFLDLGSGIPTVGNVHEIAQAANPAARVVYVDIDPVAVAHSEAILKGNPNAAAIQFDVREPQGILNHVRVKDLIDFSRPVGLLMVAILHYILSNEEALSIVGAFRDVMVPRSYLTIAQGTDEHNPPGNQELQRLFGRANTTRVRSRSEILAFFEGFELVEPGLVYVPRWRPEGPGDALLSRPEQSLTLGGVGHRS